MNDLAELYDEYAEERKAKKKKNICQSTATLEREGIKFESKNNGVHLIVTGTGGLIDFWPSTGKFIVREGYTGRGVFNLLKLCRSYR